METAHLKLSVVVFGSDDYLARIGIEEEEEEKEEGEGRAKRRRRIRTRRRERGFSFPSLLFLPSFSTFSIK